MKALFTVLMLSLVTSSAFANGTRCSAADRSSINQDTNPKVVVSRSERTKTGGRTGGRGNAESAVYRQ